MEQGMNIHYDEEGDFLEITNGNIDNCYFDNLGNGLFKIVDKNTNEIRGIAIFNFKTQTQNLEDIKLSLPFKLNFK